MPRPRKQQKKITQTRKIDFNDRFVKMCKKMKEYNENTNSKTLFLVRPQQGTPYIYTTIDQNNLINDYLTYSGPGRRIRDEDNEFLQAGNSIGRKVGIPFVKRSILEPPTFTNINNISKPSSDAVDNDKSNTEIHNTTNNSINTTPLLPLYNNFNNVNDVDIPDNINQKNTKDNKDNTDNKENKDNRDKKKTLKPKTIKKVYIKQNKKNVKIESISEYSDFDDSDDDFDYDGDEYKCKHMHNYENKSANRPTTRSTRNRYNRDEEV